MRAVNLLPRVEARRSFGGPQTRIAVAAGAAVLVTTAALGALALSAAGTATDRLAELDSLEAQLSAVPEPARRSSSTAAALAGEKSARIGALSAALAGRIGWDRVLRQISLVLPEDVWLTSLQGAAAAADAAGATATGAPRLTLVGSTYSQEGVARLLARLEVVPALENVQLQGSTAVEDGNRRLVQFTIAADLRAAAGGSS